MSPVTDNRMAVRRTMPSRRITDPEFKYVPASQTNLRRAFERVRRELNPAKPSGPIWPYEVQS